MDPPERVGPGVADPHDVVAGRYRLDRSLGTSRMAEVYLATDTLLKRSVAVKRLPPTATRNATATARFAREARALARVNDPHVVTVFDVVVDDGRPFLVMELVDGMTLRDLIDRQGSLDPARVVSISSEICTGLVAIHACGIVHRDMKPSNVFLTTSGSVKIGDFGIASVASDVTLTRAGDVFGSAPYVSPEQVTGDPVDGRADVYGLGCMMFEMATGRQPFVGDDPAALAYQHVHATPMRADTLDPRIPVALASTIDRSLAKDPADRPGSAEELRRSLASISVSTATDVGDVATEPLPPLLVTDVIPAVRPTPAALPPPRPPRPSSPILWIAGLIAAIILLLVLDPIGGGTVPVVVAKSPTTHRSPSPATSPSPAASTASPTPPPATGSIDGAATSMVGLINDVISSGSVGEHLVRDLQRGEEEVVRALQEGDVEKARDELGRLQEKLAKGVDHSEISPEDAQRVDDAIQVLAATLGAEAEQGNGHGGEGNGDGD